MRTATQTMKFTALYERLGAVPLVQRPGDLIEVASDAPVFGGQLPDGGQQLVVDRRHMDHGFYLQAGHGLPQHFRLADAVGAALIEKQLVFFNGQPCFHDMGSVRRVVWLSHDAPSFFFVFLQASGGGVLHRSIGIEPPRLPCGRAANYGSIIVPNTCHRLRLEQPGFYRVSCIARSFLRSWRTHESGSGVQPIALGMYLTLVCSVFKVH